MTTPRRVAHYEILARIGRDGPSEIYRARDLRLERDVALKLLRPEEVTRPGALDRFRREARIASLVTHPHICTVHDSGEADGQSFLVCELLEGRALDDAVAADGPLPADRVIDIGIQIADALLAAHRRGIVHANLKPSNVFITNDGHAKLLELGAAGAVASPDAGGPGSSMSNTTTVTPVPAIRAGVAGEFFHAYLSPEQVAGSPADARSDIFATGALLYEMATGTPAFGGTTLAEITTDISTRVPVRPRSVRASIPPVLEAIILRALDRAPDRRYQRAAELLEELRRARRAIDVRSPSGSSILAWLPPSGGTRRTAMFVGVSAIVLLAMLSSAGWWWTSAHPAVVERSAILVSDISNGTADPDFDGTLRQAVSVYLAQSPYLDLVSEERINGTLQLMGRKPDERMTHEVAAQLCQRLGLQAMLEGSVSAVGRTTVVALAATDCYNDAPIAKESVEVERKEDVLRALGQLTSAIRTSLGESGASLARNNTPIEEATTPSLEALKAYTQAVARRAAGDEVPAVELLERAIAIDPQFALAHTTLSSIYGGFGETGRSEEYARLAYEHRDRVSERERLFITYQYHDRATGDQLKAREALEVWKRTYQRDYRPSNALALLLIRLGDYAAAATEAEDAMRRNPVHAFPRSNLAHALRGAGRYAEARAVAEKAMSEKLET
ncbi:MAG: protein kinase, partial [Acidobacteria bacterium]|nr:protein kinase [Acidobacteriota bacterium]